MKRTHRLIAAIVTAALLVAAVVTWHNLQARTPVALSDLCDLEGARITEILIRNGTTGEAVTSVDPEVVATVRELLAFVTYTRRANQAPRAGYEVYVDFYAGDERLCRVTLAGSGATIDGVAYDTSRALSAELAAIALDLATADG